MAVTRMSVATIGYDSYAIDDGDLTALIAIARRATRVSPPGQYTAPFAREPNQQLFVASLMLTDVDLDSRPERVEHPASGPYSGPYTVPVPAPRSPLMTPADPDDDVQF